MHVPFSCRHLLPLRFFPRLVRPWIPSNKASGCLSHTDLYRIPPHPGNCSFLFLATRWNKQCFLHIYCITGEKKTMVYKYRLGLGCSMIPGSSKDIQCHVWPYFLNLQITRLDIRPHIKLTVSLVIAYGHFKLPQGFVWECMGQHTSSPVRVGYSEWMVNICNQILETQCHNTIKFVHVICHWWFTATRRLFTELFRNLWQGFLLENQNKLVTCICTKTLLTPHYLYTTILSHAVHVRLHITLFKNLTSCDLPP